MRRDRVHAHARGVNLNLGPPLDQVQDPPMASMVLTPVSLRTTWTLQVPAVGITAPQTPLHDRRSHASAGVQHLTTPRHPSPGRSRRCILTQGLMPLPQSLRDAQHPDEQRQVNVIQRSERRSHTPTKATVADARLLCLQLQQQAHASSSRRRKLSTRRVTRTITTPTTTATARCRRHRLRSCSRQRCLVTKATKTSTATSKEAVTKSAKEILTAKERRGMMWRRLNQKHMSPTIGGETVGRTSPT